MKYRLIAVDLDDSLLDHHQRISERNKQALRAAQEMGTHVTVATGRIPDSAMPFIRELNVAVPVIAYQGAYIKDTMTGKTLMKYPIPMEYAHQILEKCKEDNLYTQAYVENNYFFEQECPYSQLYRRISGLKGRAVGDLRTFLKEEPAKILIMDESERISSYFQLFREWFGGKLQVTVSKPIFLELTHIHATKGNALKQLGSMLGIPREEIIAIGDSYNDLSMIEYAGLGVAMGNAPDPVKASAQYVTSANDEDGVAEVVERFVLKRRGLE